MAESASSDNIPCTAENCFKMGRYKTFVKEKYVSYDAVTNTSACLLCDKKLKGNLTGNIKRHYVSVHNITFADTDQCEAELETSANPSEPSQKDESHIVLTIDERELLKCPQATESRPQTSKSTSGTSRKRKRHILLTLDEDDPADCSAELTELTESGERSTLGRIGDVSLRLVKVVPSSLKELWKNTSLAKQKLPNLQESPQISAKKSESVATTTMPLPQETTEHNFIIKEEFMTDSGEFLLKEEIVSTDDMHNETQQTDASDCPNQTSGKANDDVINDVEIHLSSQEKRDNTPRVSDSIHEMEKDIKKKEMERMELDIEMKKLELEFMRGRLREQEMNLKFRQLEYDVKRKAICDELLN